MSYLVALNHCVSKKQIRLNYRNREKPAIIKRAIGNRAYQSWPMVLERWRNYV